MFKRIFARISEAEAASPWSWLDVTNALSVLLITFVLIGQTISLMVINDPQRQLVTAPLLGWLLGAVLTIAYVFFIFRRRSPESLLLGESPLPPIFLLLLGVGMAILIDLFMLAASGDFLPSAELINARQYDIFTWITAALFMLAGQPLAEELVFRAVVLPKMRRWFGAWPGLVTCAGAYALFHMLVYAPQNTIYWEAFTAPFLAGLVISGVWAYTRSTTAAIITHAAFGLFALLKVIVMAG